MQRDHNAHTIDLPKETTSLLRPLSTVPTMPQKRRILNNYCMLPYMYIHVQINNSPGYNSTTQPTSR